MGAKDSADSTHGGLFGTVGVLVISLLAVPVCHGLSLSQHMNYPWWVFAAGVGICFLLVPLVLYVFVHRSLASSARTFRSMETNQKVFFYIFTVFGFTAIVDLVLALTLDGIVPTLRFYLDHGEPYLKSPHGCAINYWDGTTHFALYLLLTYLLLSGRQTAYYLWGMFWFGSIMNSIVVFLPGNVMGKWALEVQPSYFLNVPYALFPIVFFWKRLQSPLATANEPPASRSIFCRPVDCVLVVLCVLSSCFLMFRWMIAMGCPMAPVQQWLHGVEPYLADASLYPQIQTLVYAFYGIPALLACIRGLIYPSLSSYMPALSAVVAGAFAQGQFAYMFAALHPLSSTYPDEEWKAIPEAARTRFLAVNALLLFTALALFVRSCAPPFLSTFGIASSAGKSKAA